MGGTIKLSKQLFIYVILRPDPRYNPKSNSVDETLIFKYEFSEKYKYNCLYYDFSYATDTSVSGYFNRFYYTRIFSIKNSLSQSEGRSKASKKFF